MKKLLTATLLVFSLFLSSCTTEKNNENTIKITDCLNRTVLIPKNPKRVVVGDHYLEMFAVGGENVYENIVGWSATTWVDWRNDIYLKFASSTPRLKELTDVGLTANQTFSIEVFLKLDPDLLIIPTYQYYALDSGIQNAIEKAGIPIVVIDFSTGTKELHNKSISIIGQVFNHKDRADSINKLYNKYNSLLENTLKDINTDDKTTYLEKVANGPLIYDETFGGSDWAPILDRGGANNISKKYFKSFGTADTEILLTENPEYIFLAGSTWPKKPEAVQMGFSIEKSKAISSGLNIIENRIGWKHLNAVEKKQVYLLHHGFIRSVLDFVPAIYIAQKLHPTLFTDLDATLIAEEFYDEYLPVDFSGSWLVELYE